MQKKLRTIAVDLDGTLAKSRKDGKIGDPVKKMANLVKELHSQGVKVLIFSVRGSSPAGRFEISMWLRENGLPALEVTNKKTGDIEEFWDNRAIRVEDSTGVICSCCDKSRGPNSPSRLFKTDC